MIILEKNSKSKYNIILFQVVIFCVYFGQYLGDFNSKLFYNSEAVDILQVYWNTWHFSFKISQWSNPYTTDYLLYPIGTNLYFHAYTPIMGIMNVIFHNPILSINLVLMLMFIWGSYNMYILSGLFIRNIYYRCIASTFFMYNFYVFNKLGVHYNLILIALVPLIIFYFLSLVQQIEFDRKYNKKNIFTLVVLLFAASLFDYYVIFYSLSFIVLYGIYLLLNGNNYLKWNIKNSIIFIFLFIVIHIVSRLLRINGVDEKGAIWSSIESISIFISNLDYYPGFLVHDTLGMHEHSVFIGYGLLILFIFALLLKVKSNDSKFLLFALFIYLMVVTPVVKIGGKDLFYLPTSLIHYLPFVNNIRIPSRFVEMIFLLLPIYVFNKIEFNNFKYKNYFILLICLVVFVENTQYIKHQLRMLDVKAIENKVKENADMFKTFNIETILPIPFGIRDGFMEVGEFDSEIYVEQRFYNYKSTSGYFSRVDEKIFQDIFNNTFYNGLISAQQNKHTSKSIHKDSVYLFMKSNKIDAVYVDKKYVDNRPKLKEFITTSFPQDHYSYDTLNNKVLIRLY